MGSITLNADPAKITVDLSYSNVEFTDGGLINISGYEWENISFIPVDGVEITGVEVQDPYHPITDENYFRFSEAGGVWTSVISPEAEAENHVITVSTIGGGGEPVDPDPEPEPDVKPYNSLFVVDSEILDNIASNILMTEPNQTINRSDYVINLLKVPFEIPIVNPERTKNIIVGGYDTGVKANYLLEDFIKIDLGNILVGDLSGDSLDYFNAEYVLNIPFTTTTVTLKPSQVVGLVINPVLVIDAYNGETTLNVYNGSSVPITSVKINYGRSVPFSFQWRVEGNQGNESGAQNNTLSAYIRVERGELFISDYSNLINKTGLLGSSAGYVEVENIELKTKATSSEKDRIITMLKNGVFINE